MGKAVAVHADRGGTFTDLVFVVARGSDLAVEVAKVPSDQAVLGRLARGAPLTLGTTVATNALLERAGVPTLLLVTAGFEDLPALRDMRRPDLFDLDRAWPISLATHVIGVPIDTDVARLPAIDFSPFESVVIALINTADDVARERHLAELVRQRAPHLYVVVAREVAPDPGYLPRIETALVDAAITPRLAASLLKDQVGPDALAVRSDGTLGPAYHLKAHDAVLSGPAPGVLAVLATARQAGLTHAVGLDMGGTSTDVCLVSVDEGPRRREGELEVAGVRLSRMMLEVDTIAAGGGSVLACAGEALTVGPRSAGADPGPQCYGRGGPPTLTDAALVHGLVSPDRFPLPLDPSHISLPRPAGSDVDDHALAAAYLDVARESMARAIERLAMARGLALRGTGVGLVAYGGAGAQHAAFVAERLGISRVIVHPAASVFCALGQLLAARTETARRPLSPDQGLDSAELPTLRDDLDAELTSRLQSSALTFELECVYRGSDAPVLVAYAPDPTVLRLRFEAGFRARFGFIRDLPIECRALVGHAVLAHARTLPPMPTDPLGLPDGAELDGPTCLFGEHTAIAVPAGWRAYSHDGLVVLDRTDDTVASQSIAEPALARAYTTAIWQSRLMAVAEEGGAVLARLAQSVSIKERLDFSCALFAPDGRLPAHGQPGSARPSASLSDDGQPGFARPSASLVVNAPHIPVHLGAMGDTVRDVIAHLDHTTLADGDAWLTNDPAAGGSHLPDLTVVTVALHGGIPFFVASRAHHVDVGGIAPGSMPSRSTTLTDEGMSFRRAPLVVDGKLQDLTALVSQSRQTAVVVADLESQLAANAHMARRLVGLASPHELIENMALVTASARRFAERFIASHFTPGETRAATDVLDGVPLALTLSRPDTSPHLVVDFTGTGGPHSGNLNAPPAVVRAAMLYALRVALTSLDADTEPPPMNDGLLTPLTLVLPAPSIVSPPPAAAVVGGNVETSQRLVDLLLVALGLRAASAGTMNNLVIAGELDGRPWSFYETLGGGLGASPTCDGASARQVHMTNTRATDPEVLSRRLPLVVRRFARRRGSGGPGLHRGGDGLIREIEVRQPATASLLAAWREGGAPGLDGGGAGLPGEAFVSRANGPFTPWHGEPILLAVGDRVAVHTPGGGGYGPALSLDNRDS